MKYVFLLLLALTPTMVFAGGSGQATPLKNSAQVKGMLTPTISHKRLRIAGGREYIQFDVTWDTTRLPKPTRAIKGYLSFGDLFGYTYFVLDWVISKPLVPGVPLVQKGRSVGFNQDVARDMWMFGTDVKDMVVSFIVMDILYQDGTKNLW